MPRKLVFGKLDEHKKDAIKYLMENEPQLLDFDDGEDEEEGEEQKDDETTTETKKKKKEKKKRKRKRRAGAVEAPGNEAMPELGVSRSPLSSHNTETAEMAKPPWITGSMIY